MRTTSQPELLGSFARHETFHPRYGWLKKGFDSACEDPTVFLREDATTVLGVGKNMVRAMRYWCVAYKILSPERRADNFRLYDARPTEFGKQLLAETGWDPYLEDPGSLWLLHWQLLRSPCQAPAWWAIFNSSRSPEFIDDALLQELCRFRDEQGGWEDVAESSLEKDVRCLLRMYGGGTQGRDLLEDSVDSPFLELGLIRPAAGAKRHWVLNVGAKRHLPDAVVAYAALDYATMTASGAKLLGLAGLTQNPGAPGRAFALTETALTDALERFTDTHDELLGVTHAVGSRQLVLPQDLDAAKASVLEHYYSRRQAPVASIA